jgi:hypothetical protein
MATPLEIVTGISQVMSNVHDGALDDKGEPIKVGLKREEGHPILDSRIIDGFGVKFIGEMLRITYQAEVKIKDVHDKDFESNIEQMIEDIASFLKKEYKKVTGETLKLKADGECIVVVQNTSRIRTWAEASRDYIIGGMESVKEDPREIDSKFKKFLEQGGFKES